MLELRQLSHRYVSGTQALDAIDRNSNDNLVKVDLPTVAP
jgi:hypothetical protein